ncbi:hypothetical protein Pmani_027032 [Petrolisthes manimaculis]|uniref:Uncharacterized protein n=1 Tax=Petrolisthes manimaculis TaxID=1843537 RepID=A0AAE1P3J1_9EUCA|nr:hypothetical protein Pmani_027032 [Petrolisthes manimaculis]
MVCSPSCVHLLASHCHHQPRSKARIMQELPRARFRENRSIFNTPNPRLMNASLFKDSKLLSPARGDRRGSRASVRAPSRAPSVTSVNAASRSPNGSLAKAPPVLPGVPVEVDQKAYCFQGDRSGPIRASRDSSLLRLILLHSLPYLDEGAALGL